MGITTEEEIVDLLKVKKFHEDKYPELKNVTPLVKSLWALQIVKDNTETNKITAKTISYILEKIKEINLKEKAIAGALNRAGDKIKITKDGNKTYYEIMRSGRDAISVDNIEGSSVLFFTGSNSWTDPNKNFPKIIEQLKGDLCIVDPFYGSGTFYVLEKFGKKRKIRFLSCSLDSQEQNNITKFGIDLTRFRKEFKNIQMKKYDKGYELHDRYIIADNALVVIGHGIKDLANKESFVAFLPENVVGGFLPILKKGFEDRWKKSNNLT